MIKAIINNIIGNKETKNATWIIAGKVAQMAISFFIGLWTARYLGPYNIGLINYVGAYISFFASFSTLGIGSSILINEMTKAPEDEGVLLGTTIGLRLCTSFLSSCLIVLILYLTNPSEVVIVHVGIINSFALFFQTFEVIDSWFQKRYMSKVSSIATLTGYIITSLFKVYLLVNTKRVELFVVANVLDYFVIALFLMVAYRRKGGLRLRFSLHHGGKLLSVSYHFILSSIIVAVYGQTDKLMLKHLMSETEVGYYAISSNLCYIWTFVLSAIITSLIPTIMRLKEEKKETEYIQKNKQLYSIIIYLCASVAIVFSLFAKQIINILYGMEYNGSVGSLRILSWMTIFSFLGVARDGAWLICENKQRIIKYIYSCSAVINVILNFFLIPVYGAAGAAFASLLTQIMTSIIVPLFFKDLRPNAVMMIQSFFPKGVIKHE